MEEWEKASITTSPHFPITPFRLLLRPLVRRAGARRSDKQLAAVLIGDVAAVGAIRAVFGLVPFDRDHRARQQRLLVEAATQQRVGRARFDHPALDLAVWFRDID